MSRVYFHKYSYIFELYANCMHKDEKRVPFLCIFIEAVKKDVVIHTVFHQKAVDNLKGSGYPQEFHELYIYFYIIIYIYIFIIIFIHIGIFGIKKMRTHPHAF